MDASRSSSIALSTPDILRQILGYVGPGHWLFIAAVNSLWIQLYYGVASVEQRAYDTNGSEHKITCIPQMTLYSSVFASPSRLRLADKQCSIEWTSAARKRFQYAAGKYADIETLRTVSSLGVDLSGWTLKGAAAVDALAKLKWLFTKLQYAPGIELSYSAAASSSMAVLAWLKHRGVVLRRCFTQQPGASTALPAH
jgi:hypothetical protein